MNKLIVTSALALLLIPAAASAEPQGDARTKRTWKAKCASCHGEDGKGETEQAKKKFGKLRDLTDPEVQKRFDDAKLKERITKGYVETRDGKELKMPATPELAGDQLDAVVRYVRSMAAK